MTDKMLPESCAVPANRLLEAAADFLGAAMPHAPAELQADFQACQELVLSVRNIPTMAICISGRCPRGLVKWDIELAQLPARAN